MNIGSRINDSVLLRDKLVFREIDGQFGSGQEIPGEGVLDVHLTRDRVRIASSGE